MHTIETDIIIDAEPAAVWAILVDREHYPAWNPFIRSMDGHLAVGQRLTVEIGSPGKRPMRFRPTITAFQPERQFSWLGRLLIPGLFDGEHSFTLEPFDHGQRTRLVHSERFTGLLVRLSRNMLESTETGFTEFNEALKLQAEQHRHRASV